MLFGPAAGTFRCRDQRRQNLDVFAPGRQERAWLLLGRPSVLGVGGEVLLRNSVPRHPDMFLETWQRGPRSLLLPPPRSTSEQMIPPTCVQPYLGRRKHTWLL